MARKTKLTNSSDEADIASVLAGDSVFAIPYFQRPYKWKSDRIKQFQKDILEVVDSLIADSPDNHFLGAIIVHGRRRNPSDPTVFEVIDGQQRLTTVYLFIAALISVYSQSQQFDEAVGLFQKFISLGRQGGLASNLKLHTGGEDRRQLNDVTSELLTIPELRTRLGTYQPVPLPNSGSSNGPLKKNYASLKRFLSEQKKANGIERVRLISRAVLENFSVVQIDVNDPANGPKIFDSLNSQQEPMTIGDLIRNEIFSRVADKSPADVELLDRDNWQPFYRNFKHNDKNLFDSYFFPYGLTQNPNLAKSEVYNYLRDSWKSTSTPTEIIEQLGRFQNAFLDIATGSNKQNLTTPFKKAFQRLFEVGLPAASYPFLMNLSEALRKEELSNLSEALEMLSCTESFLVRRAIAGFEPTGLHSVFKRLWQDLDGEFTVTKLRQEIRKHGTVQWPNDSEFRSAVEHRSLYGAAITPFFIRQFDMSLGGEHPVGSHQIEHVLPRTSTSDWLKFFTPEEHKKYVDCLANLLPMTGGLNSSVSNDSYFDKRKRYGADAMYKSTREFAESNKLWTPAELQTRAKKLSEWASSRWKY